MYVTFLLLFLLPPLSLHRDRPPIDRSLMTYDIACICRAKSFIHSPTGDGACARRNHRREEAPADQRDDEGGRGRNSPQAKGGRGRGAALARGARRTEGHHDERANERRAG